MSTPEKSAYSLRGHLFDAPAIEAGLYLVSTPIGNLSDITLRALEVLAASDVIACEDTRTSGVLLNHYGISTKKLSYNEHNAQERGDELLQIVEGGGVVSVISDAGTPLVSDPGYRLVISAQERGLAVHPIPGANAPLAALIGSGLDNTSFTFAGFLPNKTQARQAMFSRYADRPETVMFFESPNRISDALKDAQSVFGGEREACVARELTKLHETYHRGSLADLQLEFDAKERVRGEIVLLIAGAEAQTYSDDYINDRLLALLDDMKPGKAASVVAEETGISRQELYKRVLDLKNQ